MSDADVPTDADPTDAIRSDVIEDLSGTASPTDVAEEHAEQIDSEKVKKNIKEKHDHITFVFSLRNGTRSRLPGGLAS